jgi:hypothetical protein
MPSFGETSWGGIPAAALACSAASSEASNGTKRVSSANASAGFPLVGIIRTKDSFE